MSDRQPWKAVHSWEDDASDEFDPAPIRPLPSWFKPALRAYASLMVQADELEKLAAETDDRDERRRLRDRARTRRENARRELDKWETELPADFDPMRYLRQCLTLGAIDLAG
jgi:hypothetical protein